MVYSSRRRRRPLWTRRRRFAPRRRQSFRSRRYSRRRPYVSRRGTYRRRFATRRRFRRPRQISFPPTVWAKVRYNDTDFALPNPVSAQNAYHLFRSNSISDPDYTGFGIYPWFYDQWALTYHLVLVRKAKIVINWTTDYLYTQDAMPKLALFSVPYTAIIPTTTLYNEAMMHPYAKTSSPIIDAHVPTNKGRYNRMKLYSDPRCYPSYKRDDQQYWSLVSSYPPLDSYLQLVTFTEGASSAYNIYFDVRITYYCEFKQRSDVVEDPI